MKRGRFVEYRGSGLNSGANGGLFSPDVAPGFPRGFRPLGAEGHEAMETLALDPGVLLRRECCSPRQEVLPGPSSGLSEFLVDLGSGGRLSSKSPLAPK